MNLLDSHLHSPNTIPQNDEFSTVAIILIYFGVSYPLDFRGMLEFACSMLGTSSKHIQPNAALMVMNPMHNP